MRSLSSTTRKACLTVLDHLFRCTVVWLAPMLCFTAEEAWASRYGAGAKSVHLELFPEVPAAWRDDKLADKWRKVRTVRRVVTGALEIERAQKRIGSSLEAHPIVLVADEDLFEAVIDVDLAEVCITSAATLIKVAAAGDAFRSAGRAGRRGHSQSRRRHQMCAVVENPHHHRRRSRIPGRLAARRQGAARVGNHAQGGGVNARYFGPLTRSASPCGSLACSTRRPSFIAQRGRSRQHPLRLGPFFDFVLTWNTGISYGLFQTHGPLGQWLLLGFKALAVLLFGCGWRAQTADRAVARPDHRRGRGQCRRPAGLWLGRRFRVFPRIDGHLAVQLVRL